MTPERIEEIKQMLSGSVIPKDVFFELLAALEEAEQQIRKLELYTKSLEFSRESAQKMADGIKRDKGLELYEANQTISKQREALQSIYEESEDIGARHCAAGALGIEWEGDNQ